MDLAPEDHVKVQAAIQQWTDSAISKTCNAQPITLSSKPRNYMK